MLQCYMCKFYHRTADHTEGPNQGRCFGHPPQLSGWSYARSFTKRYSFVTLILMRRLLGWPARENPVGSIPPFAPDNLKRS